MITVLILLLLIQSFTQNQASSPTAPAVEVLDLEVLAREYKPRGVPDSRTAPPPGPVSRDEISGRRRETSRTEQPTIADRSRELGAVGRRQPPRQPAVIATTPQYSYEYRVRVKNISPKKIRAVIWEYQFTDTSGATVISQQLFRCAGSLKMGEIKVLKATTSSPPSRVVSADTSDGKSHQQKAVVNSIEYTDGSTWTRDGWTQDEAAALPYRPHYCVIVSP